MEKISWLKEFRAARTLSQAEMAAKVGVSQQSYQKWEISGEIGAGYVIAFAAAFGFVRTPHEIRPDMYPHPEDGLPDAMREMVRAAS
jgi:DNA-binding XRE family transcriptional regulator